MRRAETFAQKGIDYIDVGTSGGVWGFERGYCMMIGGKKDAVERLDPIFAALAPGAGTIPKTPHREGRDPRVEKGYLHAGPVGSGHFVKMVHNGIEYGLMQAYAEGFDILRGRNGKELAPNERFDHRSRRCGRGLAAWQRDLFLAARPDGDGVGRNADTRGISKARSTIAAKGAGRSTRRSMKPWPHLFFTAALYARFRSRIAHSFGEKILSAMRNKFGGHVEGALEAHKPK